ncbi:MAG: N-acetylgalactosamine-4-sulfatase, partial [Planctomycetaceae bacterium]
EIRLRRWPEESDQPINASLPPGANVPGVKAYRTAVGEKIEPTQVTIKVGDITETADVAPGAKEVVFNLRLKAGKTRMSGLFKTADGKQYGTYYAYVKKK